MKYLLVLLLVICNYCSAQRYIKPSHKRFSNYIKDTAVSKFDTTWEQGIVSSGFISASPIYDTTLGFIEIIDSKGLYVRGMGIKIDSLSFYTYAKDVGTLLVYIPQIDTIKTTLKVWFDACDCLLDIKKWFTFIPINMVQPITIFRDDNISISPNK